MLELGRDGQVFGMEEESEPGKAASHEASHGRSAEWQVGLKC